MATHCSQGSSGASAAASPGLPPEPPLPPEDVPPAPAAPRGELGSSEQPAPKAGRSPAECADKAANFVIPCAVSLAAVPAASPTLVGSFVAGAAAGLLCVNAYNEYADCVEGRK